MDLESILNGDSHSSSHATSLHIVTYPTTVTSLRSTVRPKTAATCASSSSSESDIRVAHDSARRRRESHYSVATSSTGPDTHSITHIHSKHPYDFEYLDPIPLQSLSLGNSHALLSSPQQSLRALSIKDTVYRSFSSTRASTPLSSPVSHWNCARQPGWISSSLDQEKYHLARRESITSLESTWSRDIVRPLSKEQTSDNISASSEDVCGSDTEDEHPPRTPDTPVTEHVGEAGSFKKMAEPLQQLQHQQLQSSPSSPSTASRSRCSFDASCELLSPDRKVTSHYFGRNKKETRAIPEACWVLYCRQHYQRVRYRSKDADFARIQMGLVKATVENLEHWGGVRDFSIALRKRAMDRIKAEDDLSHAICEARKHGYEPPLPIDPRERCRERWLLQFTGSNVAFERVYTFIDMVVNYCQNQECQALEFEVVPNFRDGSLNSSSSSSSNGGNDGGGGAGGVANSSSTNGGGGAAGPGGTTITGNGKKRDSVRRTLHSKHGGSSRVTKPSKGNVGASNSQVRTKMIASRPSKKP